ncbi:MAG: tyrosine--tRNA ligase [Myxococcota bacterium]
MTKPSKIDQRVLDRYVNEIISQAELDEKVKTGKQLRVKFGVDCTAPFLHLGHAVNLWLMRHFQEAGHVVDLLLGVATTRIGDPTGRSEARPVLTDEEIEANAAAFVEQAGIVLLTDPEHLVIRRNSEWFDKMNTAEFLSLASRFTVSRLESRNSFRNRTAAGQEVRAHELLYPILQAYDSVMLGSDLAPVGNDQLFNETMGREMQQRFDQPRQVVMTTKITMGLDGTHKQSKSRNNYVALVDTPTDKFGKVMTLPDEEIINWLVVYTDVPMARVAEIEAELKAGSNPRDAKMFLARSVVERYHGAETGRAEEQNFVQIFSKGALPDDMPDLELSGDSSVIDALAKALPTRSKSDLRRLVGQGGVKLEGEPLSDINAVPGWANGSVLKVGKRQWFRITVG